MIHLKIVKIIADVHQVFMLTFYLSLCCVLDICVSSDSMIM